MSRARRSAQTSAVNWPTRQQDHRGVEEQIDANVAPVQAEVDAAEKQLEELERAIAGGAFVSSADVELRAGGYGGTVILEHTFTDEQIGAPVLVNQAPSSSDDEELGIVLFVGEVLDRAQMRLRWFSMSPAPARARVNFIVGLRS